ncbi:MAG: GNAT family N-acetyltransferase, partial [Nocardioidaceae bacterium]
MANPEHADDEPGNPPEQPTLCDGDVTLRPWTYDDVEPARLQHDEEMAHWFGFPGVMPPAERQRAAVEQWHADYADNRKVVAFLVQHGDQVAGTVEVRQRGDGVGELSWAVFRDHRGRGVGARAVRLLIDYCFADLGLVRVGASVEVGNTAS